MPTQTSPFVVSAVDNLGLFNEQPDANDFYLAYDSGFGGVIGQLNIACGLGSGTATLLINNVPVTGITNVPVNQNRAEYLATSQNVFSVGDDVILRILTVVNMQNLKCSAVINRSTSP